MDTHSSLQKHIIVGSLVPFTFALPSVIVRSLSVCCPFVVRSIDEQQAYDNQTSFALQSDMHRGCTLGKISILVQSFWENGIYVSRGRMFSYSAFNEMLNAPRNVVTMRYKASPNLKRRHRQAD